MGEHIEMITPLHTATKRNYLSRMLDEKSYCAYKAKEYEFDYWDGDKRFGYGGYRFIQGRWKPVAEKLIERFCLDNQSKILDVGCGKGFLLYELKLLLPKLEMVGFDISKHALLTAKEEVKPYLKLQRAQNTYSYPDGYFDLVFSINTLHNLRIFELQEALYQIERVGKQKYIVVESYRNLHELFNLQCWALTAESFFDRDEWIWLFQHFNYTGDYEFIYFE